MSFESRIVGRSATMSLATHSGRDEERIGVGRSLWGSDERELQVYPSSVVVSMICGIGECGLVATRSSSSGKSQPCPLLSPPRRGPGKAAQPSLRTSSSGAVVDALDDVWARATNTLATQTKTSDVVDACVVEGVLRRRDLAVNSEPDDLTAIAHAAGHVLEVEGP